MQIHPHQSDICIRRCDKIHFDINYTPNCGKSHLTLRQMYLWFENVIFLLLLTAIAFQYNAWLINNIINEHGSIASRAYLIRFADQLHLLNKSNLNCFEYNPWTVKCTNNELLLFQKFRYSWMFPEYDCVYLNL